MERAAKVERWKEWQTLSAYTCCYPCKLAAAAAILGLSIQALPFTAQLAPTRLVDQRSAAALLHVGYTGSCTAEATESR